MFCCQVSRTNATARPAVEVVFGRLAGRRAHPSKDGSVFPAGAAVFSESGHFPGNSLRSFNPEILEGSGIDGAARKKVSFPFITTAELADADCFYENMCVCFIRTVDKVRQTWSI